MRLRFDYYLCGVLYSLSISLSVNSSHTITAFIFVFAAAVALDVPGAAFLSARGIAGTTPQDARRNLLSLIGVIFLDQGLEACSGFVRRLLPILG